MSEQQSRPGVERLTYGDDPSQHGDLHRPGGASRGVVVVIHGGFWRAQYDASLGAPLAEDLARHGWTAWNLEYRRVGGGGGWPATFDDVAAGIDRLADVPDLDTGVVLTLGHSAGGHLAAWAAGRDRSDRWPVRVAVTGVVSQAGVLDLTAAYEEDLGDGAVAQLLGRPPGPSYDEVDPVRQVPLGVPVVCVHGSDDTVVPLSQSQRYAAASEAAGGSARVVEIEGGDHFAVIDTEIPAWQDTLRLLEELAGGSVAP